MRYIDDAVGRPAIEGGVPVRPDFLPFNLPLLGKEEENEILDTLRSGWLTTGPKTKKFEELFKEYTGCEHAVALNSCTAALHLALEGLGIKEGDEVITTPVTFAATANVIVHRRAKPVFTDINPETLNIDPAKIESAITSSTKAIIPVHLAGQPCDMEHINDIAAKYKLYVIEDAAHALGAEYDGIKVGSGKNVCCFSFYPNKNITTIEGGMLCTNNSGLAEKVQIMGLHGLSKDAWQRYALSGNIHWEVIYPGYKYNMTDMQASLGIHQINKIDRFIEKRKFIAEIYDKAFSEMAEISLLKSINNIKHAYHLYIIKLKLDKLKINRDEFMAALKAENIGVGIHFKSLHLHPYYKETYGFRPDDFPAAADTSEKILSLPLYPRMTVEDAEDVIAAVRKLIIYYRK